MPQPGEVLKLSREVREALGHEVLGLLDDLERDHQDYFDDIGRWYEWYNAKPLTTVRNEPWPYASNIVVPIIRTHADSVTARLHGRLHTPRTTWTISTEVDEIQDMVKPLQDFLNAEARQNFDIQSATRDWVNECVIVGESVLAVTHQERRGYRFRPGSRKPQTVILHRGPMVEHVPREYMLWRRDRRIDDSDVVVRKNLMTWGEIANAVQMDDWDEEGALSVQGHGSTTLRSGRNENIQEAKRGTWGQGNNSQSLYDIREVWVEWPLADLLSSRRLKPGMVGLELRDADDPAIPIVLTMHRDSGVILRAVAHPYYWGRWPFFDVYFRKIPGMGRSVGVAKLLEHVQRGITTMTNQSIDGVTFSNSLKLLTQNQRVKNMRWTPNQPVYVENLNDVREMNLAKQVVPDIALINMLNAVGERVTGITDPLLGRETRYGGHPSPATSTMLQIQEGGKLFDMTMREFRVQLSRIGEFLVAMYQQFPARMAEVIGEEDAARAQQVLIDSTTFKLDVFALNEMVNPDTERNNAVLLNQAAVNYYAFVLRLLPAIESPQTPPLTKEGMSRAIQAVTKAFIKVADSMDFDDPDKLVIQLKENRGEGIEGIRDFMGGLVGQGQAQVAPGPVPGGGMGGPDPGANGASAAMAAPFGPGVELE